MLEKANQRTGDRLGYAAFPAGHLVHGLDHFRRGFDGLTPQLYWAGQILSRLGLIARTRVLLRNHLAPLVATLVGFPTALGVAAWHLLPRWSSFSDAFPGSAVDALS